MTTPFIRAKRDRTSMATGVIWQWARGALGALSAGIGICQIAIGHGLGAAFSFFMAATFLLSVACERAIVRTRRAGVVVPGSLLLLLGSAGVALGGAIVLGVLVAIGSA